MVAEQSVVVMVHDEDLALPGNSAYPQREGGWGLGLVSALAESSAMTAHPGDGKTAWFRVLRGPVRAVADNAARRAQDRVRRSGDRVRLPDDAHACRQGPHHDGCDRAPRRAARARHRRLRAGRPPSPSSPPASGASTTWRWAGLPTRRSTVVAGQAGSAKTLFAAQFLAEGVRRGQPGVFVTLEEPAADLRTQPADPRLGRRGLGGAGRLGVRRRLALDPRWNSRSSASTPWPRRSATPSTAPAPSVWSSTA